MPRETGHAYFSHIMHTVVTCELPFKLQMERLALLINAPLKSQSVRPLRLVVFFDTQVNVQPQPLPCFYGSIFPTHDANIFATRYYGGKSVIQLRDLINSNG